MPGNILNIDTAFPQFEAHDTVEMKLGKVMNYLYMLLEQLRYTLENLGTGNFNAAELDNLTHMITDPVMVKLADMAGNMAEIGINAGEITSRMTNAERDISQLQQTADTISTTVSAAEGDISQLKQTADTISTTVAAANGDISQLQQTATGLETRITNVVGDLALVSYTASKVYWLVADGTSASEFTLTPRAIKQVAENITLDADRINLNGNTTLKATNGDDDLVTEIDGNRIAMFCDDDYNGSDSLSRITYVLNTTSSSGWPRKVSAANIYLTNYGENTDESARFAMLIQGETISAAGEQYEVALKLRSDSGISLEAGSLIYLSAPSITLDGDVVAIRPKLTHLDFLDAYGNSADNGYIFCTDGVWLDGDRIL